MMGVKKCPFIWTNELVGDDKWVSPDLIGQSAKEFLETLIWDLPHPKEHQGDTVLRYSHCVTFL